MIIVRNFIYKNMYKSVYLKKGKEESLKRFHPWIFSGAIQTMDEGIEEGDIERGKRKCNNTSDTD